MSNTLQTPDTAARPTLSDQLRDFIRKHFAAGFPKAKLATVAYAAARTVAVARLEEFLNGTKSMTLETAELIIDELTPAVPFTLPDPSTLPPKPVRPCGWNFIGGEWKPVRPTLIDQVRKATADAIAAGRSKSSIARDALNGDVQRLNRFLAGNGADVPTLELLMGSLGLYMSAQPISVIPQADTMPDTQQQS